jgi:hypothetical protein
VAKERQRLEDTALLLALKVKEGAKSQKRKYPQSLQKG